MNKLVWILFLKTLFILMVIFTAGVGLGPEEAQYWCWSQALDIGYYSKPPGIAWQIWSGCKLFGNSEFGVRFFALVFSFLESLVVYALARACALSERSSLFAALIIALSPLGMMGAFLATTDGGLVLFWTLTCLLFVQPVPNYTLMGLTIMCGALFKWPIFLLWAFIFPYSAPKKAIQGFCLSLLAFLPTLIWNFSHDFVTFRHVWFTLMRKQEANLAPGNIGDFIGGQVMLLTPILFVLLLLGLRSKLTPPLKFCAKVTYGLLFSFAFISIFKKMQANWVVVAYPTAAVLIAYTASRRWLVAGLSMAATTSIFMFAITAIQSHEWLSIPFRINPFIHYVGWQDFESELAAVGFDPKEHFLFSDKYQMSSMLSFYGQEKRRAYFFNMQKSRKNQFSFWPTLKEEQLGKTGYFVLVENIPYLKKVDAIIAKEKEDLEPYFSKVDFLGVKPLFLSKGEPVKAAILFRCEGYNGKEPEETALY